MTLPENREQICVTAIGDRRHIRTGLAHAVDEAGWCWRDAADVDAFVDVPRHPRSIVIVSIETFTLASLDLIGMLATEFDLPVIVYALESHPMMVRAALEAGADDFVASSARPEEIIARLRAVIRVRFRDTGWDGGSLSYHLDQVAHTVSLPGGATVRLTLSEYHVFKALLAAGDQPVPRSRLATVLAPFARSSSSGILDATIARLRRKIGAAHLRTVRGVGYQLIYGR